MNKKGISTIAIILIAVVAVAAVAGGYILMTSGPSDGEPTNGEETTDGEAVEWSAYEFEEGEYYEYRSTVDPVGTVTWEVLSVSGDQVTVESTWNLDGETGSMTVTGDEDTVYQQLLATPAASIVAAGFYAPWVNYYAGYGFEVGNSWSITTSEGTFSVRVTGTETYGGQQSYVGEAKLNGQLLYKVAVSKDLGFPTYVAVYEEETGEKQLEVILQEYHT